MMDIIVKETRILKGTVRAPPSKSLTHRAFIAASLSHGLSVIEDPLICDDTFATIDACRMLGARIREKEKGLFEVQGCPGKLAPEDIIDCRESASTMRFLTPVCALAEGISVLTGGSSLRRRPMGPLLDAMRQIGVRCYSIRGDGYPPIIVFGGGIAGGEASIPGDVSSQFISGLLFAAPLARNDTCIRLTTPLESRPYVMLTMEILRRHGIHVEASSDYGTFHVPCRQSYSPSDHTIEGDYSSAAFILAAAAITDSRIRVTNLRWDSLQGDKRVIDLLEEIGVEVKMDGEAVSLTGVGTGLSPFDLDLRDNPDLVPVFTVLACFARGESAIRGVRRLRIKESDRVAALIRELTKMGAEIHALNDAIKVKGGRGLRGAELDSHGDHRIAMACVISALGAEGTSLIRGVECINKSYPNFLRDIRAIGAKIIER